MAANQETPFFVSYARARERSGRSGAPHFSDQLTRQFFFDLSEDVGQLISRTTGSDVGFMDTGMPGGTRWRDELLHAAGTCQVLIALVSAPYLSSKWCGMEWYAFSQRTPKQDADAAISPRQGHIVPVLWAPIPFAIPPPVCAELVFSPADDPDPGLPAEYKANGVYGLLRMKRKDSYQIVVWHLARLIADIYHNQVLEPREFEFEELKNAFQGAGNDE
jgi:hypothetical protein